MQSWGPPLGSREAVRTLEYTLLHLAGKEVEWGSCYGLNDTLRTSAPLALPHTRQQPPGCLGKKGEEGVHTSVVPEGLSPVSSLRHFPFLSCSFSTVAICVAVCDAKDFAYVKNLI